MAQVQVQRLRECPLSFLPLFSFRRWRIWSAYVDLGLRRLTRILYM